MRSVLSRKVHKESASRKKEWSAGLKRSGKISDYCTCQHSGHWWFDKTVPVTLLSQKPHGKE